MSSIREIEAAIEKLSPELIEELARWLDAVRIRRATPPPLDRWLEGARGAARPDATTDAIMFLTRGEE